MFFEYALTIPKNTTDESPRELEIDLAFGVLTRLIVQFPAGCAGLVGVQIHYRFHQLFPSNPDGWFVSDNYALDWAESYDLLSPPFRLLLKGYNDDDTFGHTVYFRFQITHPDRTLEALLSQGLRGVPLPQLVVV